MIGGIVRGPDDAGGSLSERGAELGLAVGMMSRAGSIVTPAPARPMRAWLDAPSMRAVIETASQNITGAAGDLVEPAPGIWVLPLSTSLIDGIEQYRFAVHVNVADLDPSFHGALRAEHQASGGSLPTEPRYRTHDELKSLHAIFRWMARDLDAAAACQFAVDDLGGQLGFAFEQISTLYEMGRMLNSLTEPRAFMEATVSNIAEVLDVEWVAIRSFPSCPTITSADDELIWTGELPCLPEELIRLATPAIQDWRDEHSHRIHDVGQSALADAAEAEVMLEAIHYDDAVIGGLLAGGKRGDDPEASSIEMQLLRVAADFLSVFHQNSARYEVQRTLFTGTVRALSAAIDAKDPYTQGHSERVGLMASQLAQAAGLDVDTMERMNLTGLLHDVGKIGVAEAVLCKAGKLTDDEYEQIKQHPRIGYDILKDIPPMADMLPGVLYHHERIDGRGYPDGLVGDEIPLIARIIAVADGFDAMSSNRAYRAKMSREKVFEIMREGAGTQWDADLIALFLELDLSAYDAAIDTHRTQNTKAA